MAGNPESRNSSFTALNDVGTKIRSISPHFAKVEQLCALHLLPASPSLWAQIGWMSWDFCHQTPGPAG